ncbi:LysR family transcriptional regulator [Adlercreutzia sp. ZJ473]|uniref:LysR family transcriptional regulator n=1 Tax=Adlercreutzia sp. ZJ473 TaxID=2722822 RepID=UPI0015552929|nr:LysR family transcriptional regulator [Adlercreutzia sp. ZJ473]
MRVETLALFLSVAQYRSISHAARQHYISQQGASAAIKGLEAELEVALFDRTPTGLQLTGAGQAIAKEVQALLDAYRRVQVAAALGDQRWEGEQLTVVSMPFVTNRLDAMFSEYDSMAVGPRLRIVEQSLLEIARMYAQDESGALFLVALPSFAEGIDRRVVDDFSPLVECELMVACAASHPLASRGCATPEDLGSMPIACYCEEFLMRILTHIMAGGHPNIQLLTSNLAMIGRAVASGEMITFTDSLSTFLDRPDPNTVVRPIRPEVLFRVGMLGVADESGPAARFARFMRQYLSLSCSTYLERHGTASALAADASGGEENS